MYVCAQIFNLQSVENCSTITVKIQMIALLGNSDYNSTAAPDVLTIQRGQETACSNITIINDNFIEFDEHFTVSIILESTNFSAGVTLVPDNATVVIVDGDGECSRIFY